VTLDYSAQVRECPHTIKLGIFASRELLEWYGWWAYL